MLRQPFLSLPPLVPRSQRGLLHLLAGVVVLSTLGFAGPRLLSGSAAPPPQPAATPASEPAPSASQPALEAALRPAEPTADPAPEPTATGPAETHRVVPGESVASIAAEHGVSVQSVLWANDLADPALVRVDAELRVPVADGLLYTLQPGDSLRGLAERAGLPLPDILAVNRLPDPDNVPVGTEVLLPGEAPRLAALAGVGTQQAAATGGGGPLKPAPVTYEVQPGDTLAALGTKFGIDLETLLAANDIADPDTIRPGTTLRILPVAGVEHVVQPGERLTDIAARYQTMAGLIIDFNAIADPDLIRAGDRLLIPGGKRTALPAAAAPAVAAPPTAPAPPAVAQAPVAPAVPAPKPAAPAARPAAPAAPVPSNGSLGQRIAAIAQQFVGAPYVWGGTSPSGFDCSGLVWYVMKEAGAPISRGLWGQYNAGKQVSRSELQPGDIVFYQNTYMPGLSHDGIYVGNGLMVNAVDEANGVKLVRLDNPYWESRWFGATRVTG